MHQLLRHYKQQRLHAYNLEEACDLTKDHPASEHRNPMVGDQRGNSG